MAKYKDYPVYTYDEPATYSDFSGGINTDPSNEHLLPNEMRDCLNMHYSSAALVKRKGASLLCNISCEDELFNVQGVFLFTYRTTYIIIAADGKLYKGIYTPHSTSILTRLPITIDTPETLNKYDPINVTVDLPVYTTENIDQKHDGFIYNYVVDKDNKRMNMEQFIGNYLDLDNSPIKHADIVKHQGYYYQLEWTTKDNNGNLEGDQYIIKEVIYPTNTNYWISLDDYNIKYKNDIEKKIDPISLSLDWLSNNFTGLRLAYVENVLSWVQNSYPGSWVEREGEWSYLCPVLYEGKFYICIKEHTNYINPPSDGATSTNTKWIRLIDKKELIFQNTYPIESATYKNKLYLTTGTKFIVVELINNNLVAHVVQPYKCNTTEIVNIGYNYLSPYPELCRETQYNQVITSIGGVIITKDIFNNYTLKPQMTFAQGETEEDYFFKWEKKIQDEWVTIYSYKDNIIETYNIVYVEDKDGTFIKINDTYVDINIDVKGFERYRKEIDSTTGAIEYIQDNQGKYIKHHKLDGSICYLELAKLNQLTEDVTENTIRYKRTQGTKKYTKRNLFSINVSDADKYQYRVSFAKSFENSLSMENPWEYNKDLYKVGDKVSVQINGSELTETYVCIQEHTPSKVLWDNCLYERTELTKDVKKGGYYSDNYKIDAFNNYILKQDTTPIFSPSTSTRSGQGLYTYNEEDREFEFVCYDTSTIIPGATYWEKVNTEQAILTEDGVKYDWIVNEIDGEYFGQGSSTLFIDPEPEDTFKIIHSCKKITSDGNKFLLYDDKYNSGSWYKTIIDNPTYITHRGGLSFKTNKNESLIKVIPFNGTLIAFANAENVGGSIHMITGNGDDWDDQSGYYSPYRRKTINATVSCNNASTVQVCENILVFKYFDILYYISGSELNNEVVSVYSCNDKIKHNNNFVKIPWDDNNCISEVTEDYYALIWKEKYIIDDGDLILDRPALKIKMYYKLGKQQNEKIVYPWLRDESEYFNIEHVVYIKGKPIYLYNNTLTTLHEDNYTDYSKPYICKVHFRGEDLNYPKMSKLISNVLVYYHRNQYSKIDFDLTVKNEAGHILLDSSIKRFSIQDLRALKAGDKFKDGEIRLDSTILDSKVFNTSYKFPLLLADTTITAENDKEFSISSITYNYITTETPDQTLYDLYTNILRPKEVK